MFPVIVRNVRIGEGLPKICAPIIETTKEAIFQEASSFSGLPVDIVEWRVDWFEGAFDHAQVAEVLAGLRQILGETPLLMTFRTAEEGGARAISPEDYQALNVFAAQTGFVDLLDVQLYIGDFVVTSIISEAHKAGVKVICSNHDFHKTPHKDTIVERLRTMERLGADISKIAVMPQSPEDVLTLLHATEEMSSRYAEGPIVTMSMSGTGTISRLAGEIFGSSITFGAAKKASAPGQIAIGELKKVLTLLHNTK